MHFNSVQSGNFLAGAKSINENVTDIYNTAIQTGFAADEVIKQANANNAVKQMATARRQASMANTAMDVLATAKVQDIEAKLPGEIKDIMRPAVRMEGINRMAGSVAAGAYILDESKKQQKEQAELKAERKKYTDALRKYQEGRTARDSKEFELLEAKIKKLEQNISNSGSSQPSLTTPDNKTSNTSQNSTQANQPDITSLNTSSYTGSLDSLSPEDKKWIAFGVSGESKPNTDDDFGVASVILTRMKNRKQSAYDVVHAPGQFAAVVGTPGLHGPTAKHVPGLVDRLFSPEGMAKIEEATKKLDGRAYFKGQSQLKNRSNKGNKDYNKDGKPDMDPMFHPLGNLYHYGHQG